MSMKAHSSYTIIDVVDGLQWKADSTSPPNDPKEGWAYYNTQDRKSYIYDGEKWVVFTRDGDTGPDGHGIDDEVLQYCQHTTYSSAPTSGWGDTFPAEWDSTKPYVWKRTKQIWNYKDENGEIVIKTTAPELMSQLDVATIMAQNSNPPQTLDEWCVANDVTVISGSQIATGTITADHIDVNHLSAISANLGTVKSGNLQSPGYLEPIVWEGSSSVSTKTPSDGLVYTLSTDGKYYIVSGRGTCTDANIVIPDTYEGLPVTTIGESAFRDCSGITKVILPSCITSIGFAAFLGCNSLESINIPEFVTSIDRYAFSGCTSLTKISFNAYNCSDLYKATQNDSGTYYYNEVFSKAGINGDGICVTIGKNVKHVPAYLFYPHNTDSSKRPNITMVEFENRDGALQINRDAFYSCNTIKGVYVPNIKTWCMVSFANEGSNPLMTAQHLYCDGELVTNLIIPEGIKKINQNAFRACHDIVSIVIPDSVTEIGYCSFNYCTGIKDIVLGKGIETIVYYAFNRRINDVIVPFEHVYYKGTEVDWSNIEFTQADGDYWNDPLILAPRYYYSETAPTVSGNYWHYEDGFKISCNDDNMIDSKHFKVTQEGEITATSGHIGGWEISEDGIRKNDQNGNSLVGMSSGDDKFPSLKKIPNVVEKNIEGLFQVTSGGGYKLYYIETDEYVTGIVSFSIEPKEGDNNLIFNSKKAYAEDGQIIIEYNAYFTGQTDGEASYNIIYEYIDGETIADDSPLRFYAGYTDGGISSFAVLEDGTLYANAAKINGHIEATSGNIGGWEITPQSLVNYSGQQDSNGNWENSFCMQTSREEATHVLAIGRCQPNTWGYANFRVKKDGTMFAKGGKVGACEFCEPSKLTIGTHIEMLPLSTLSDHIDKYSEGLNTVYDLKIKTKSSPSADFTQKIIRHFDYDDISGATSGDANQWSATYGFRFSTSDSNPTPNNETDWIDMDQSGVNLTVPNNAPHGWVRAYIYAQLDDDVYYNERYIYFYIGNFSSYQNIFKLDGGIGISGRSIGYGGNRIEFKDDQGKLSGTWYGNDGKIVSSWRGAKSDIENLDDRYSTMFDELRPVRFKYNDGQSQRYHTGLILDELKMAMDNANVDSSEFAAYCVSDETTGEGGIRYGELVSLCIDQIQKLKKRVEELEEKLNTTQND